MMRNGQRPQQQVRHEEQADDPPAWDAAEPRTTWPEAQTARLVAEKYGRPEWNERP